MNLNYSIFFLELLSSKVVSEEFFLWDCQGFPFDKSVFCACGKVSVCLRCVFTSRIDFSLNLMPLYTTVSKNTVSVSDVSPVNLIAG